MSHRTNLNMLGLSLGSTTLVAALMFVGQSHLGARLDAGMEKGAVMGEESIAKQADEPAAPAGDENAEFDTGELSDTEYAALTQSPDGITTYTDEYGNTVPWDADSADMAMPDSGDTNGGGGGSGGSSAGRQPVQCVNPPARPLQLTHTESFQATDRAAAIRAAMDAVATNMPGKCVNAAAVGAPACPTGCRTLATNGVWMTSAPVPPDTANPKLLRVTQVEVLRVKKWEAVAQIRGVCTATRTCQP